MDRDEQEIRQLLITWMDATKARDVDTVLSLISDDAVFLLPGRPVMRKAEFAAAAIAQSGASAPTISGHSEIQELRVLGDWAFTWTRLTVVMSPADGTPANTRAGHTLTLFHRQDGQWRLARDANLLAPVPPSPG
ncbi:MAG: SgcJ/EcaC family oxidoreductase [Tahibacter sp.]